MKLIPQDFWDEAGDLTGRVTAALEAARDGDRVHLPGVAEGVPAVGVYVAPLGGWRIRKGIAVGGDGRGSLGAHTGTTVVPGSVGDGWDVFVIEPPVLELDFVYVHDLKITHREGQGADGAHGLRCLPADVSVRFLRLERLAVLNLVQAAFDLVAVDQEFATLQRLLMLDCGTNGGEVALLGVRMTNVRFATVVQSAVFSYENGGWLVESGRVNFYACGFENNGRGAGATQGQLLLRGCAGAQVKRCVNDLRRRPSDWIG